MTSSDILKLWRNYEYRGPDAVVMFARAIEDAERERCGTAVADIASLRSALDRMNAQLVLSDERYMALVKMVADGRAMQVTPIYMVTPSDPNAATDPAARPLGRSSRMTPRD